jgi:hypothetical protein
MFRWKWWRRESRFVVMATSRGLEGGVIMELLVLSVFVACVAATWGLLWGIERLREDRR